MTIATSAFALQPDRALTQYVQRIWQTQQGLPEGGVSAVMQAPNGYIWIATETGLSRFDGVRFTPVEQLIPGVPDNLFIRTARVDPTGAFWLATRDRGLVEIRGSQIRQYTPEQGLPSGIIWCIEPAHDGTIWICSENGLANIDPKYPEQPIHVLGEADGLAANAVRALCEAPDGTLWTGGTGPHLTVRRNGTFSPITLRGLPPATSIRGLVCDGDTVWAGTTFGLVRIRGEEQRLYTEKDGLADNFVLTLAAGSNRMLWIGTRSGFSRLIRGASEDTIDSFMPEDGLSQSSAQVMFEDREGSLWVGTKRGLNQFVTGRSVPYTVRQGLPSNSVGPVIQDAEGTVWIGTLDAGLTHFDGHKFTTLTQADGLPSKSVIALDIGADNSLWVGTDNGLAQIRDHRVQAVFRTAQGLPSNDIRCIYQEPGGNLLVGTATGLASYQQGHFQAVPGSPHQAIRTLGRDKNGKLLVATNDSVFVSDGDIFRPLAPNGGYMRNANTMYVDHQGLLWIGLNGAGLRLFDGTKLTTLQTGDGLYDAEIYGIIPGDTYSGGEDRLWLASSSGLFWLSRSEVIKFAEGKIHRITSVAYTPTDALRVIEGRPGVEPGLWRMRDGRLWYPTVRGMIALEAGHMVNGPLLPLVIEDPQVNGQAVAPQAIAGLPGGRKNIVFNYGGLSYAMDNIRFRYRLNGFDRDWVEAGSRRDALYTNLPPGDYTFWISACNDEIPCGQQETSVSFTLTPLIYQRAWFWPLMLLLLSFGAWTGYQLHIRRLRQRYDLILSERSRIARELHDTLIQGFSGITMALQGLQHRIKVPEEKATLQDIISDAATCLTETRQSVAGLRNVRGPEDNLANTIERAVREIAETKDVKLKFRLGSVPKPLPPEVEYNLLRILTEAVTNSIKHSGADTIEVTLDSSRDALHLLVADDGAGFTQNERGTGGAGHYGLIGMKERATQIGAVLTVASRPGGGTSIMLELPSGKSVETAK